MKRMILAGCGLGVIVLGSGLFGQGLVLGAAVPDGASAASSAGRTKDLESVAPRGSDPQLEKRIDDLLAKMTLEEKIGQMCQLSYGGGEQISADVRERLKKGQIGSFLNVSGLKTRNDLQRIAVKESRLGIPLVFGRDVIHGYRTVLPIPLGQSCSWNPDLVEKAARVAGEEAYSEGVDWTFAPMVDIARDPRWGRIAEGCGEDPFLTSAFAAAMVKGFQGKSLNDVGSIAACAKHYVGYGAAEGGRDYNTTWIPERQLRDVYLPSFHAAAGAGAATFMSSFNEINGVPASANAFTLRQVLRREWGFDGFVVSDWESTQEMINHGFCADRVEVAKRSALAGVDMEMVSECYRSYLADLVKKGEVPAAVVDNAVRAILRIKFRKGLFERPMTEPAQEKVLMTPEHFAVAKQLATQSLVLLKNEQDVLPLSESAVRIAVIGPLADSPVDQMGCWTMDGRREDVVTPLAAIRRLLGEQKVAYAAGLKSSRDLDTAGFAEATAAASSADAAILFVGEEAALSGEARSRAFLGLPGAGGPRAGGRQDGQARGPGHHGWPAPDVLRCHAKGTSRPLCLASRHCRRPGRGRRPVRQGLTLGQALRLLPSHGRPGSDLLRPQEHGASSLREVAWDSHGHPTRSKGIRFQVPRRGLHARVSIWIRALLCSGQVHGSDLAQPEDRSQGHIDRPGHSHQHRHAAGRRGRPALRSRPVRQCHPAGQGAQGIQACDAQPRPGPDRGVHAQGRRSGVLE